MASLTRTSLLQNALLLLTAVGLLVGACSPKPPVITRQNVAPNYQPASDYNLTADHLMQADSLLIWLRFGSKAIFRHRTPGDLGLHVRVQATYQSTAPVFSDSVANVQQRISWQGDRAVVRLSIARQHLVQGGLVALTLIDRVGDQRNTLDIPLTDAALKKEFILMEAGSTLPLFRHYLNPTDSFRIVTPGSTAPVTATQYKVDFPPALPPMSLSPKKVSPTLPVLGSHSLSTQTPLRLTDEGLYALQPEKGAPGIVLVLEDLYPELTTARDLIEPLIYITTTKEREALYKAAEPKKAVDKFWLGIGGTEAFAKRLIQAYYSRVTDANKLFSSHKPGWLTDRGMIYIVMGRPAAVHRFADHEEWTYNTNDTRQGAVFNFYRKEHTLTQNHYELLRDPVFEPVWYRAAEQWRKGIIDP